MPWIPDRIPVTKSGFFVRGIVILDSNRYWDSRFLVLYSGFQSPGFQIPPAKFYISGFHKQKIYQIPDSEFGIPLKHLIWGEK